MTSLFDTHVHLTDDDTDPVSYVERAVSAGVDRMLFCSSGMENSARNEAFAATSEHLFFAVGVHPHEAQEMTEPAAAYGERFAASKRMIAIGELGLDYYYDLSPAARQQEVLKDFLSLALDLHLPAVIHCRDKDGSDQAYADAFRILEPFAKKGGRFELHSYAGSVEWLKRFESIGARFGVGGMLTFKRADNIREAVAAMPQDRILLETDAPYLAPVPHRGKINHPAFLPYTAAALAQLLGITSDAAAELTTDNACRFFGVTP